MCYFPEINYQQEPLVPDSWGTGTLPSSPRGMRTLLVNRHLIPDDFVDVNISMVDLESEITKLIDKCDARIEVPDADMKRIFYLIQIWGGRSGRQIFVRQAFDWTIFSPLYRHLINVCRSITIVDDKTCADAYTAIVTFLEGLRTINYRGLKIVITMHVHFWMHKNLPDNMLPIYGSTFAQNITREGDSASLRYLLQFWAEMRRKSEIEGIGLTKLERLLFVHYSR